MRAILVANRKLFLMGLLLVAGAFCVLAVDNDNDGMSDAYELFFGLNPSVDDASDNNDSDSLSNYEESLLWTDPFVSDTDDDGWLDDADSNAVSRALIPWGDPLFTDANDMVTYSWPSWMISAWAVDGAWTTNPAYAWHSSYADGSHAGWLNMDVDRTLFSSNLVMRLDFYDHTNSSMFIDLYDTNDLITVTNLCGNLTTGTDSNVTQTIEIPFADYSSAVGIHIRKGDGAMTIYQSLLYIDADLDGLDASQEEQLGTSDTNPDTDGDGISDYDEVFTHGTNPLADDASDDPDSDGDGVSDAREISLGKDPATSNRYHTLPFVEMFKANTVTLGDLYEQNGWDVSFTDVAMVQTTTVQVEGDPAMELNMAANANAEAATVQQIFTDNGAQYVWVDTYTKPMPASPPAESSLVGVAGCMYFNAEHQLVVWDGAVSGTNKWVVTQHRAVEEDDWVRTTMCADYASKTWSAFINGVQVATDLTFADTTVQCLSAYSLEGGRALVDGLSISTNQPSGLSFDTDSDAMPDDWETTHFGDLSATAGQDSNSNGVSNIDDYLADTDPVDQDLDDDGMPNGWELAHGLNLLVDDASDDDDSDGLTNLGEYQAGSDPNDSDSDDDGMPDGWEVTNSLNPLADDAAADPDSDDLNNLAEYQAGSDPNDSDSDDDGMPDGWELTYGLDPLTDNSTDDPDVDGVLNLDEYLNGLNPTNAVVNTDGDLLSDVDEIYTYMTDVFATSTTLVTSLAGTNTSRRTGAWAESGDLLYALTNRGQRVEYEVSIPSGDMYLLRIDVTNTVAGATTCDLRMQLLIDGVRVEWIDVSEANSSSAMVLMDTPWLPAGDHTVRLAWLDDYDTNQNLGIDLIGLYQVNDAADANSNDRADWVDAILAEGHDTDGDGISDIDELGHQPSALNPLSVDTDGDTLSDYEETHMYGTDPLLIDSDTNGVNDALLLVEQNGVDTSLREVWHILGAWYTDGDSLVTDAPYGRAYYDVTVTNDGMYRVGLELRNYRDDPPDDYEFRVRMTINGYTIDEFGIFADVDLSGRAYLNTRWLTAGTHRIGLEWENHGYGGGRAANMSIEKVRLYAVDGPDANSNGIQDWVEAVLQASSFLDTDGDGLFDIDEVTLYGTSPVLVDTDNDGIDDGEEVSLGTTATDADTDDDGISDGVEVNQAFTDPNSSDFGAASTVLELDGSSATNWSGSWEKEGSSIYAASASGYVDYDFNLASNGTFGLEVEFAQRNPLASTSGFDLSLAVDGKESGRQTTYAPYGTSKTALFFMPELAAGAHTVRVTWHNVEAHTYLQINAIRVKSFAGDAWLTTRLSNIASIETPPATSIVSPICLEGDSKTFDHVRVNADYIPEGQTQQVVTVQHSLTNAWYADVLLSPSNDTAIAVYDYNDELTSTVTVTWTELNLLVSTNALMIRDESSLLLTAYPTNATNGSVSIDILLGTNVVTNLTTDITMPAEYLFDAPGIYTVTGTYINESLNTNQVIQVEVVGSSFSSDPTCLYDTDRPWANPSISSNAVIQYDARLTVGYTALAGGGLNFTLNSTSLEEPLTILARLGADGPILDNSQVTCIESFSSSYREVVTTFDDGSTMVRMTLRLSDVPSGLTIDIEIAVGGVIFDDGTTERTVTAADFNETGEYVYYMVVDAGVDTAGCHILTPYDDGVKIQ